MTTPKPWALGNLIVGSEWQGQKGDMFSVLRGARGLPQVEALMVERYGRFPVISGVSRRAQRKTLEVRFTNASTREAYRTLILQQLDTDDEDPFRLTIVDNLLPGLGPEDLVVAFGPWDLYYDGSNWRARGLLEQATATLAGAWSIAPGEGLDLDGGSDACTLTSSDLSGVNAIEVIWKPTEDNTYGTDRYLFDGGSIELYFKAADDKFYLTDGTTTISSAAQTFAAASLQHVVARFSVAGAGEMKLVVNGTETTGLGTVTAFGATCYIGSEATPSKWCRGELVAWRGYDDLTSTQIAYLYAAFSEAGDDPIGNARHLDVGSETVDPLVESGKRTLDLVATLAVDDEVRWRSRDGDYWHWDVTSSGDQETVTVDTEDEVYPVLYITPKAAKTTGLLYKRWVPVVWKADAAVDYPTKLAAMDTASLVETATTTTLNGAVLAGAATITLTDASSFPTVGMAYITDAVNGDEQISWTGKSGNDLTGCTRGIGGTGDVNHSNLDPIAVSKMLANGGDLRVYDSASEIDRWILDPDTATTDVWVVVDYDGAQSTTLEGAMLIGDSVSTLDAGTDISDFPYEGILLIDSEAFTYRGKNDPDQQFLNVTRAVKGTSAAGHADEATIYWIQHDFWIFYGDHTLSAPSPDATVKPIFELDTSNNDSWVYQEFGDSGMNRAGRWVFEVVLGSDAKVLQYTGNQGANADPWAEPGVNIPGDALGYGTDAEGRTYLYNVCGITNANFTNGEYRSAGNIANNNIHEWEIISSIDGITWTVEYTIADPPNTNWQSWSRNEALTSGSKYVALNLDRSSSVNTENLYLEAADCTLTLNTTYTPDATLGSEQSNYPLDCTIANAATGYSIQLQATLDVDDVLQVDTDAKTVTNLTEGENLFGALTQIGGIRRAWLALLDGDNVLTYTETGVVDVDVDLVWDRRYFE